MVTVQVVPIAGTERSTTASCGDEQETRQSRQGTMNRNIRAWRIVARLAERVGFEPTNTREDVTEFPVQRLRPLGHLSGWKGCEAYTEARSAATNATGLLSSQRCRRRASRPRLRHDARCSAVSTAGGSHPRSAPCVAPPT